MALKSCQSGCLMKVFQRMDLLITQESRLSQETVSWPPSCVEPSIVILHWCGLPSKKWQSHQERTRQWAARPSRRCPLLFEQTPPPRGASDVNNEAKNSGSRCCSGHGRLQGSRRSAKEQPWNAQAGRRYRNTSSVTRALRSAIRAPLAPAREPFLESLRPAGLSLRPLFSDNVQVHCRYLADRTRRVGWKER